MNPVNVKYISISVITITLVFGLFSVLYIAVPKAINATAFSSECNITKICTEMIGSIKSDTGNRLLVAEVKNVEVCEINAIREYKFFRANEDVRIRVSEMVIFRYYINIDEKWDIDVRGDLIKVKAPKIQPLLPPSPMNETLKIETNINNSHWLTPSPENIDDVKNDAIRSLSEFMNLRSMDKEKMDMAQEKAKEPIRNFVLKWIVKDERLKKFDFIIIFGNNSFVEINKSM